ncbi:hypothetical protein LDENG_00080200 [Lucifuga dentata]|nr:hypothetical protein LDENG_00080200 [Lucifuga dentata]
MLEIRLSQENCPKKSREEIIALQGNGYNKIANALNVPRDTVGSTVHKFKVKGTLATLPEHGRKRKLSTAATRFLQVVKNPRVTAKDLQQDLVAAGTKVSICTVRHILKVEGLYGQTPRRTPLLTHKHKKSQLQYARNHINKPQKFWDFVLWSNETKLELFGPMDQRYVLEEEKKSWKILEWSSQSPDLNPIENLRWDLKKAVAARKPKNINELEAIAHEEWGKIPQERCQKLMSGYASRLQQVITAKECSTKY